MGVAELLAEAAGAWGKDWDTVTALLRRAVRIDPWRADVRAALGLALSSVGDMADATRQLHLALDLDPDHPKYWADLAMVAFRESDYSTACSFLEESIVRRPDFVWAMVELTRCYSRLGYEIAMSAAGARAINLDPIGEPTRQVASILVSHRQQAAEAESGPGRRFLRRRAQRPRRPGPLDDFLSARDLPFSEAIPVLERILAILDDECADYFVVLETLADMHFHLDQHVLCAEYSRRAVNGLTCVRALVAEPRQGWMLEAGREHDAKAAYGALIRKLFNEEAIFTVFELDPNRIQDLRRASVHTDSGIYEIQRGGNLFVINTPRGDRVIHEAFDRSDLPFAEW